MKCLLFIFCLVCGAHPLAAQLSTDPLHLVYPTSQFLQKPTAFPSGLHYTPMNLNASAPTKNRTPLWAEIGYITAMQTTFTGLSYLASRKNPALVGGIDLLMGVAGFANIPHKESKLQKAGYYFVSAGFLAKALYNFRFAKNHNKRVRFWTNFIGFNILVFTGYAVD